MKRLILFFGCCLMAITHSAQTLGEQDIIQKMASAARETKSIRADFTQTRHSKMLKKAQVSEGKMFCRQPDKLRWEYTSPRQTALVLDGTNARLTKDGSGNGGRNRFAGEMARLIMNSVAGKYLTDDKAFQVSATASDGEYVATLVPVRKEMKRLYTKLVLHFDPKQSVVTKVELYEKDASHIVIELHDIQTDR